MRVAFFLVGISIAVGPSVLGRELQYPTSQLPKPDSKTLPFPMEPGDRLRLSSNWRENALGVKDVGPQFSAVDPALVALNASWRYLSIFAYDLRTDSLALNVEKLRKNIMWLEFSLGGAGSTGFEKRVNKLRDEKLKLIKVDTVVSARRDGGIQSLAALCRNQEELTGALLIDGADLDEPSANDKLAAFKMSYDAFNQKRESSVKSKNAFELPVGAKVRLVKTVDFPIAESLKDVLEPRYGRSISLAKVRLLEGAERGKEVFVECSELTNDIPLEGESGYIYDESSPAAFKQSELREYLEAKSSGDSASAKTIMKRGRILTLRPGDAIEVLQWSKCVQVKVRSGGEKGKTLWLSHRNISSNAPPKRAK